MLKSERRGSPGCPRDLGTGRVNWKSKMTAKRGRKTSKPHPGGVSRHGNAPRKGKEVVPPG